MVPTRTQEAVVQQPTKRHFPSHAQEKCFLGGHGGSAIRAQTQPAEDAFPTLFHRQPKQQPSACPPVDHASGAQRKLTKPAFRSAGALCFAVVFFLDANVHCSASDLAKIQQNVSEGGAGKFLAGRNRPLGKRRQMKVRRNQGSFGQNQRQSGNRQCDTMQYNLQSPNTRHHCA